MILYAFLNHFSERYIAVICCCVLFQISFMTILFIGYGIYMVNILGSSSYGEGRTRLQVRLRHMNECRIFHNINSIAFLLYSPKIFKISSQINITNGRNLRQIQYFQWQSNVFIHTGSHTSWREMENDVNVTSLTLLAKQWHRRASGAVCTQFTARNLLYISRICI